METSDLIRAISSDAATRPPSFDRLLAVAGMVAMIIAAAVFFAIAGPRADFIAAAETPRFLIKFVIVAALAVATYVQLAALARPGARIGARVALLTIAPAILAVAILVEFATVPSAQWGARWVGSNSLVCLTLIPLIGLGPLAVFLAVLRLGAPTRPALAGAAAGLLAGGLAAFFYAAHCFDNSPFFVATWYSIAIAMLTFAGAAIGRSILRW